MQCVHLQLGRWSFLNTGRANCSGIDLDVIHCVIPGILTPWMHPDICRVAPTFTHDREQGVFVLDQRLLQDTLTVGDFPLCRLLLSNDSHYPWFILVPRRDSIFEIFELSDADQAQLWKETSSLAKTLEQVFAADKMNVAALGNVVRQLHMHVIVRYTGDDAWPAPVWGKCPATPYSADQALRIIERLKPVLADEFVFSQAHS